MGFTGGSAVAVIVGSCAGGFEPVIRQRIRPLRASPLGSLGTLRLQT